MKIQSILSTRLDKHFAACSAAAVGVASLVANQTPANASIIYSGIQNAPILPSSINGGVYINLEPPFSFAQGSRIAGWDINPYQTGQSLYVNGNVRIELTGGSAANLALDSLIDSLQTFSPAGRTPPWYGAVEIPVGATGFIGFRFDPDSVPGTQDWFGWFRLTVGNNSTTNGRVIDWAYENSGVGIRAGDTGPVPEPPSLAILAMGAAALVASRRRRIN